jgi:hypothetical protein
VRVKPKRNRPDLMIGVLLSFLAAFKECGSPTGTATAPTFFNEGFYCFGRIF